MKKTNNPKFHHYVPQFQLRTLADDNGLIWAYDRLNKKYLHVSPKVIGGVNKLYTYKDKDGNESVKVERLFSQVEGTASSIVKKLHLGNLAINDQEKADLSMLIALNWLRTPSSKLRAELTMEAAVKMQMRVGVLDKTIFEQKLKSLKKETGSDYGDASKLREGILGDRYRVRFEKSTYLVGLIERCMKMSKIIQQMTWQISIASKNRSFVIPDINFTVEQVEPRTNRGLLVPGSQSMCVLTNKIAITMLPFPGDVYFFNPKHKFIRSCNVINTVRCQRFLFSNSKSLLTALVERTKINSFKPTKIGVKVYSGIEGKEFTFTE